MTRTEPQTRALFDDWAGTYDADLAQADGPLTGYAASLRAAAAMLPLAEGAEVLDVGIGTGTFAALLATRGARLSGIDPSPAMLAQCHGAHPDFVLDVGSFVPIPHPNGRFDAVASAFAFHEVAPAARAAACAEVARVLRPGGHFCLLDIAFASPAAMATARQAVGAQWDADEDYPLVGDLHGLLRRAGLVDLRWRQTGPYHWAIAGRAGAAEDQRTKSDRNELA